MVQPIKIYVGNVPQAARNSELKELFEKFGKVVECDILKEFAFVHMDDTNDAKAAIAGLNDSLWKGSRIRVELSTTKTNKGEPSHRYKGDDLMNSDRLRRRSTDRDRGERRSYHPTSAYSSRGGDPYMYRDERAIPYDRYNAPHRLSKNDLGNLGPMRESRYGSSINSRSYLPERGRPYPDNYERNGDYPAMRANESSSRAYGGYPYPASSYRSGSPHDLSREFRDNRSLDYADSYMRPPMDHYPPHHLNHASYYRGAPGPPGSSRYNYDHPSFGPPASTRGSRYTPPSSYPASSSSTSSRYRSHNGASSPHHRDELNDNHPAPYSNGRRVSPSSVRNGSSTKRRHQSISPRPDHLSSSHQRKSSTSHIKSKEEPKIKISSRSSSSNVNISKANGKKSHRSDTPMSSSAASSNSSSPSYSSVKHETTTSSSQSNRSSRRRKLDVEAKKEKSFSPASSPVAASSTVVVVDRKKKSVSRIRSHSNSPRSRSRSSKRSNRY